MNLIAGVLLSILRPIERILRARLRRAVARDPEFREWVLSRNPDLRTLVALGFDQPGT